VDIEQERKRLEAQHKMNEERMKADFDAERSRFQERLTVASANSDDGAVAREQLISELEANLANQKERCHGLERQKADADLDSGRREAHLIKQADTELEAERVRFRQRLADVMKASPCSGGRGCENSASPSENSAFETIASLSATLESKKAKQAEMQQQQAGLEERRRGLDTDLGKELKDQKTQSSACHERTAKLQASIQDVIAQKDKLELQRASLEMAVRNTAGQLRREKEIQSGDEAKVSELTASLAQSRIDLAALEASRDELEAKRKDLEVQVHAAQQEDLTCQSQGQVKIAKLEADVAECKQTWVQLQDSAAQVDAEQSQIEQQILGELARQPITSASDQKRVLDMEDALASEKTRRARLVLSMGDATNQRIQEARASMDQAESTLIGLQNLRSEEDVTLLKLEEQLRDTLSMRRESAASHRERLNSVESTLRSEQDDGKRRDLQEDLFVELDAMTSSIADSDLAISGIQCSLSAAQVEGRRVERTRGLVEKEQQLAFQRLGEEFEQQNKVGTAALARNSSLEQELAQESARRVESERLLEVAREERCNDSKRMCSTIARQLMKDEQLKSKLLQLRRQLADALGMDQHAAAERQVVAPASKPGDDDEKSVTLRVESLAVELADELGQLRNEAIDLAQMQLECRRVLLQDREKNPKKTAKVAPKLAGASPESSSSHEKLEAAAATLGGGLLLRLVRAAWSKRLPNTFVDHATTCHVFTHHGSVCERSFEAAM